MSDIVERGQLRRIVLIVALLNFAYFFVEFGVAVTISSVSLMADSVDFLEDTAVNLLIFMALGWAARSRAIAGKVAAVIILVPALVAGWQAIDKAFDPAAPEPASLILAAPIGFRLHVLAAWTLFAFWPFSRLVHVFSAPVGYVTRPYIVYRSREAAAKGELVGTAPRRRGW